MALTASVVWEVETGGSDTQCSGGFDSSVGSPGTDYSQQSSAQVSYTDLAIGATNTQLTSAAHPFTSAHVGNLIQVTAGTGFTTGWYTVNSVSGSTATMDRAVGTANSTAGTGYLGGALASPGQAFAVAVASNTVYVKSGTYTLACDSTKYNTAGGPVNISQGGNTANNPFQFIGYSTNRTLTNSDTPPVFNPTTSANLTSLVKFSQNYIRMRNFSFTNTNTIALSNAAYLFMGSAGVYHLAERIKIDGNAGATSYGIFQGNLECVCVDCYVTNTTNVGYTSGGNGCSFRYCTAVTCTGGGFSNQGLFLRCIAKNCTGAASDGFNPGSAANAQYIHCVADGCGRDGFKLYYDTCCDDCVSINNGGWGYNQTVASNSPIATLNNCAGFNNTSGNVSGGIASYSNRGFITLTGNPFNNSAGGDYSLNSTPGQGASLKGTGYPQTFYGLSTSSFPDVGAAQGNTGATVFLPFVTTRTRTLVRVIPKRLPALIIATPGPVVPLARQRMWSMRQYPKRQPPAIIPGAAVSLPIPMASPPRIMRQRLMYPKRVPAQVAPALAAPPVVITKQPRVVVRNVPRPIARKSTFIGQATSGIIVLEESTNVFRFDPGSTSKSVYFKIRSTATGQALKGLTTSSSGANAGYVRSQGTSVNIPLVQLVTAADAWTSGGFIEVDQANSPGEYRLDMPNAALASGADFAVATLVFTNAFDSSVLIRLEKSTNNVGSGAIAWTIQANNSSTGLPLPGATVWVTTDQAGTNTVAGALTTNAQGQCVFFLNAGTFYVWISDAGFTETNPTTIVVS